MEYNFTEANAPKGITLVWDKEMETEGKVYLGDAVIGKYVDKKEHVGDNDSNIYMLEVEKEGEKMLVSMWGTFILDDKFAHGFQGKAIPLGAMVKIEYLGKQKSQKGGRTYRSFKVGYAIPETKFEETDNASTPVAPTEDARDLPF